MPWSYRTNGWSKFESFIGALDAVGISYKLEFSEEFHSRGRDSDCMCLCGIPDVDGKVAQTICPCCEGTCEHKQHLRIARFRNASGRRLVVEEWLSVSDYCKYGESLIDIVVYGEGQRPPLITDFYVRPSEIQLPN